MRRRQYEPLEVQTGRLEQRDRRKDAERDEARQALADLKSFDQTQQSEPRPPRPVSACLGGSRVTIRCPPSPCSTVRRIQRPASALSRRSSCTDSSAGSRKKHLAFVDEKVSISRSETLSRANEKLRLHDSQKELFKKQQRPRPKSAPYQRPPPKSPNWKRVHQRVTEKKAAIALDEHHSELVVFAADADDREVREDFYVFKKQLDDYEWNLANPYSCDADEEAEEPPPIAATEKKMNALRERRRLSDAKELKREQEYERRRLSMAPPEEEPEPVLVPTQVTRLEELRRRLGMCWGNANSPLHQLTHADGDVFWLSEAMALSSKGDFTNDLFGEDLEFSEKWARQLLLCAGACLHRMLQKASQNGAATAAAAEETKQRRKLDTQLRYSEELEGLLASALPAAAASGGGVVLMRSNSFIVQSERILSGALEKLIAAEQSAAAVLNMCVTQNEAIAAPQAPLCSSVDARLFRAQGGVLVLTKGLQMTAALVPPPKSRKGSKSEQRHKVKATLCKREVAKLFRKFAKQNIKCTGDSNQVAFNIAMSLEDLTELADSIGLMPHLVVDTELEELFDKFEKMGLPLMTRAASESATPQAPHELYSAPSLTRAVSWAPAPTPPTPRTIFLDQFESLLECCLDDASPAEQMPPRVSRWLDRLCISPEPAAEFGTLPSKPFIAASDKKVHQELAVAQAAVTAADAKRAALAKAHDSLMGSTAKREIAQAVVECPAETPQQALNQVKAGLEARLAAPAECPAAATELDKLPQLAADMERMIGALAEIQVVQRCHGKGLIQAQELEQARVVSAVDMEADVARVALLCCLCAGAPERRNQLRTLALAQGRHALLQALEAGLQEELEELAEEQKIERAKRMNQANVDWTRQVFSGQMCTSASRELKMQTFLWRRLLERQPKDLHEDLVPPDASVQQSIEKPEDPWGDSREQLTDIWTSGAGHWAHSMLDHAKKSLKSSQTSRLTKLCETYHTAVKKPKQRQNVRFCTSQWKVVKGQRVDRRDRQDCAARVWRHQGAATVFAELATTIGEGDDDTARDWLKQELPRAASLIAQCQQWLDLDSGREHAEKELYARMWMVDGGCRALHDEFDVQDEAAAREQLEDVFLALQCVAGLTVVADCEAAASCLHATEIVKRAIEPIIHSGLEQEAVLAQALQHATNDEEAAQSECRFAQSNDPSSGHWIDHRMQLNATKPALDSLTDASRRLECLTTLSVARKGVDTASSSPKSSARHQIARRRTDKAIAAERGAANERFKIKALAMQQELNHEQQDQRAMKEKLGTTAIQIEEWIEHLDVKMGNGDMRQRGKVTLGRTTSKESPLDEPHPNNV